MKAMKMRRVIMIKKRKSMLLKKKSQRLKQCQKRNQQDHLKRGIHQHSLKMKQNKNRKIISLLLKIVLHNNRNQIYQKLIMYLHNKYSRISKPKMMDGLLGLILVLNSSNNSNSQQLHKITMNGVDFKRHIKTNKSNKFSQAMHQIY